LEAEVPLLSDSSSSDDVAHGIEATGRRQFPLINSVRALAAFSVLTFHVAQVTGSTSGAWWGAYLARLNVGVTVFFVISAFLLYRPFVAAREGVGRPVAVRRYLRARALRILPAYWFALTVLIFVPGVVPDVRTRHWWIYAGLLQVYSQRRIILGIPTVWSLCTEVAFYLVLPLYAWVIAGFVHRYARSIRSALRLELTVLALLAAASIALRTAAQRFGFAPVLPYTLAGTFAWFSAGLALALVSVHREKRGEHKAALRSNAIWAIAIVLYLVACAAIGLPRSEHASGVPNRYTNVQWLSEHVFFLAIACLLMVVPVLAGSGGGLPQRFLRIRWIAWLGTISYAVFLWHVPVLVYIVQHPWTYRWTRFNPFVTKLALTAAASIVLATISYYFVETPFLRLKLSPEQRRAAP
jgi:peptidoglycan/LPS O-acetylase OafA/YrhL